VPVAMLLSAKKILKHEKLLRLLQHGRACARPCLKHLNVQGSKRQRKIVLGSHILSMHDSQYLGSRTTNDQG